MSFRYIFHHETDLAKQFFRRARNFLSVLERAGRMVGNYKPSGTTLGRQIEPAEILADISGEPRHADCLIRIRLVVAKHIAVILHRGAASRGGDQDGIEALDLRGPCIDLTAGGRECRLFASHVMDEGAATALIGHHHLDAVAREEADRGSVDRGGDHGADAAGQQRHPAAPGTGPCRARLTSREAAPAPIAAWPRPARVPAPRTDPRTVCPTAPPPTSGA